MKYGYLEDVSKVDFKLPSPPNFQKQFFPKKNQEPLNFYIGSSVWADPDFNGHFYPPKTPQKNFLAEYSKQFKSVEVNATRYGTPKATTLNTWKNAVPDDFRFSFKMPQIISVRKNLLDKDVLERLEEFVLAMDSMGKKAGTTFVLLQNSFNKERLTEFDQFLSYLPHEQSFAVEIRNPGFNQSIELAQVLSSNNIASVITDTAGEREVVHQMTTNNTAYIRFVGNGLVKSDYQRIDEWINNIGKWIDNGITNFYCLHHQPNQNRRFAGYAAKYMIDELKNKMPNISVQSPKIYESPTLF